jgi:hypothetical protein
MGGVSETAEGGSASDRRVAVVVVAGVGDAPRNDAAQRIASGLVVCAGFDPPVEHSEWFKASGGIQPMQRFATKSPGGADVDLYEYWWADLSRFPAALRSFLAAFVGLFLAFPSIGRTALRDDDRITKDAQNPPRGTLSLIDYRLVGLLAWLMAVPVVVISATVGLAAGGLLVTVALPDAGSVTGTVALGLYGVLAAIVALWLIRHYEKQSGRRPAFALAILAVLATAGLFLWRLLERGTDSTSIQLAAADTVAALVAYAIRIVWLGVLAVALATTIVLAIRLLFAGAGRDERRGRTISAVITLGFGPLGLASLMAIFSGAIGAVGEKLGKGVTWGGAGGTPLCLAEPDDWHLAECAGPLTAWEFGSRLLAYAIYSLAWALAVAVGTLAFLALVTLSRRALFRTSTGDGAEPQAGRLTRLLGVVESPWTCYFLLLASLVASYAAAAAWLPFLPFLHPREEQTTWGPTVAAVLGWAVTVLLIAGRAIGLSPTNLASEGKAPGALRTILDKPYDISTFLREPLGWKKLGAGVGMEMPRRKMLDRYEALLAHVMRRTYERIVFVTHSQGTILTTTLLAEDGVHLPPEVSLITFGCPLRQLYLRRFPSQYGWVARLRDPSHRREFVKKVNCEWVNVAAAGDPIGRTVFEAPPEPWTSPAPPLLAGSPKLKELLLGAGGHSSYWTAPGLYKELKRLIDSA